MLTAVAPLVLAALLAAPEDDPAARPRIVVLDLVAEHGVDDGVARLLNEYLLTAFAATGKYRVFGGSDLQAIMGAQATQQSVGCSDTDCLAELGGALGAKYLATTTLGRIGDTHLLNAKILDVQEVVVVSRWSEEIDDPNPNALLSGVRRLVAGLTSGSSQGGTAGAGISGVKRNGGPAIGALPMTLWAVGGVALGVGTAFGIMARDRFSAVSNREIGSQLQVDAVRSNSLIANIGLGLGMASVAAGLTVWLLGEEGGHSKVAVIATPHATAMTFAHPF